MSVTPIEQVSSDRISSVISRLPFAKRARAVRPNDNPHPSLVALPAKAGIPLRADHDRRARSTERIEAIHRYSKQQSRLPDFARMTMSPSNPCFPSMVHLLSCEDGQVTPIRCSSNFLAIAGRFLYDERPAGQG